MSNFWRSSLFILIGLLLGYIIFEQMQDKPYAPQSKMDTSIVKKLSAQNTEKSAHHDISISENRRNAITRAVQKVSPAVVSINVTEVREYIQRSPFSSDPLLREFFPEFFSDRVYKVPVESVGSGFVFSPDGHILTNEHVVENAEEIIVATGSGDEYKATVIGTDPVTDVALLDIDVENAPYLEFGNSDQLLIGEWTIAFGNPFGLFVKREPTVTVGVVSAVDRDFTRAESKGRVYQDMIQTDASINNGNSGGPLCDADGKVIGMNTFIVTSDRGRSGSVGIGFAIPINRIKTIVDDLKEDKGIDRDFWIGMYGDNLTPYIARQFGYSSTEGAIVKWIERNSPAQKAGLELGDIIIAIGGKKITNFREAREIIASRDLRVGDKLKFKVWREGKTLDINILLEKRP
ncbi:MAG: trypsin-like serine protease [Caldithrix sp.]|nr:trypsin-like serine protease [Caldithrix sp.]